MFLSFLLQRYSYHNVNRCAAALFTQPYRKYLGVLHWCSQNYWFYYLHYPNARGPIPDLGPTALSIVKDTVRKNRGHEEHCLVLWHGFKTTFQTFLSKRLLEIFPYLYGEKELKFCLTLSRFFLSWLPESSCYVLFPHNRSFEKIW